MTFWDHLDELRARVMRCLWIFFAGFIACYFVSERLLALLQLPLFSQLPVERRHLYYTGLFENFFVHLRVAGFASLALLSPIYFLLLWGFVAPGLHPHEKKKVLPFVGAGSLFFLLGASFAYFVLFPAGVKYFLAYGSSAEVAWLTLDNYISLILKILVGFGAAFELPVVVVLLASIGIVTPEMLVQHRRTAVIGITIVAALIAPPDAVSMLLLMVPMYLLFEGSVVVVRMIAKRKITPVDTTQY